MPSNKDHAKKEREVFASNFLRILEQKGKTQADVVANLGFTSSTVSDWANAKKYPRVDKMQMLADYLGVWISELREEKKPLPDGMELIDLSTYHRIPILGRIAAGLPIYAEENIEGYTLTDLNHGGEYFALRVNGDSMNAAQIMDGGLVIVRRQEEVENGEVAVILVDMENATVKRFYRTETTVTLMPQSTNPEHRPQVYDLSKTKISVLGKVIKAEVAIV